jgi:hypothetical protein
MLLSDNQDPTLKAVVGRNMSSSGARSDAALSSCFEVLSEKPTAIIPLRESGVLAAVFSFCLTVMYFLEKLDIETVGFLTRMWQTLQMVPEELLSREQVAKPCTVRRR